MDDNRETFVPAPKMAQIRFTPSPEVKVRTFGDKGSRTHGDEEKLGANSVKGISFTATHSAAGGEVNTTATDVALVSGAGSIAASPFSDIDK